MNRLELYTASFVIFLLSAGCAIGETEGVVIRGNVIRDTRKKDTQVAGIRIGEKARTVKIEGTAEKNAEDQRAVG